MWHSIRYRFFFLDKRKLLFTFLIVLFIVWASVIGGCVAEKYRVQEMQCLAMNIYHEARGEPMAGKIAIGIVTMNRVHSPNFPNNVCQVVYQRTWSRQANAYVGEFSWTQDTNTDVPKEDRAWLEALYIAKRVYAGEIVINPVSNALYYHATYIKPYWAKKKKRLSQVGNHVFYL